MAADPPVGVGEEAVALGRDVADRVGVDVGRGGAGQRGGEVGLQSRDGVAAVCLDACVPARDEGSKGLETLEVGDDVGRRCCRVLGKIGGFVGEGVAEGVPVAVV